MEMDVDHHINSRIHFPLDVWCWPWYILSKTYRRINGFQGLFIEVNALEVYRWWEGPSKFGWTTTLQWMLMVLPTCAMTNHSSRIRIGFSRKDWRRTNTYWTTPKTELLLSESNFISLFCWIEICRKLKKAVSLLKETSLLFEVVGIYLCFALFTGSPESQVIGDLHRSYRTFSDQCLLESTEPADGRKLNIHS